MGSEPTIFLVACLVSLALTALIREMAPRIGLTDNPDGHRKLHGRATPLGGGVAVYLTSAIILGTLWVAPSDLSTPGPEGNADTDDFRARRRTGRLPTTTETPRVPRPPTRSLSSARSGWPVPNRAPMNPK